VTSFDVSEGSIFMTEEQAKQATNQLCSLLCVPGIICRTGKGYNRKHGKLSLGLINEAPLHKNIWGIGGVASTTLTLALDGGEWSASLLCRFTPGDTDTGINLYRRLDGL
jgi:hypothetical protein